MKISYANNLIVSGSWVKVHGREYIQLFFGVPQTIFLSLTVFCDAIQHLIHHKLRKVDLFKEASRKHKKLDIRLQTASTSYPDTGWK